MDLSETILAAMIGAAATLATASFQLFMAFRSRKAESKPKRGTGVRSLLAVFAIVLGAAVAGFAYSELRSERDRESNLALQEKLSQQVEAFASSARRLELLRGNPASLDPAILLAAGRVGLPGRSEAIVQVAACRTQMPAFGNDPIGCDAAHANRVALCASVPARASVLDVMLYARAAGPQQDWEGSRVNVNEDIGGARFSERAYELEQGEDGKAVCANFSQWNSDQGHVARIVVLYSPSPSRPRSPDRAVASEPSRAPEPTTAPAVPGPETQASVTQEAKRSAKQAAAITQP